MITVLVIDGDPAVRLTLKRVLERAGFAVIAVADGLTALRRLASLKMDLVIAETAMPGLSGEAAIAEIGRADPAARILALSDKHRELPAAPQGAVAMLGKPFTESELLSAVRRSLARPPGRLV
jgi:CheY-like chemotaxis protein